MAPPVDSIDEVMDHVNQPVHSVGLSSARKASSEGSNLANLSFSHLKVELKNAMSSRKNRKSLTSGNSESHMTSGNSEGHMPSETTEGHIPYLSTNSMSLHKD